MLNVTHATKAYGNHTILNQVSFSLNPGQIVALAGPSGSGKSTLLRCIQNLERLDEGTIAHKGTTGFVFQDFQLFPHLTVLENVAYALRVTKKQTANNALEKAKANLKLLGLKTAYYKMPHQLSGGQRQRAAIARALVLEPDLLLCDEPTSGLDGLSGKNVAELFLTLKNQGVTMLIASHDLNFVSAVADRIIVLNDAAVLKDFMIDAKIQGQLCWDTLLT
jgi:polar amino acid transport system ATP-binding protein